MRINSQLQMILWTFIAVIVMGAGVVESLIQAPQPILDLQAKEQSETKIDVAGDREPASAEPRFSALNIDEKGTQAVDFNVPCQGQGRFSHNVVQVRLTGTSCEKTKSPIETSEIRNVTNGFSATVFYPRSNAYTTDYITLASGKNLIRIQHILKSGAKVQRDFVIDRQ